MSLRASSSGSWSGGGARWRPEPQLVQRPGAQVIRVLVRQPGRAGALSRGQSSGRAPRWSEMSLRASSSGSWSGGGGGGGGAGLASSL